MNKTLNKIIKELKVLHRAERKYLKETGGEAGIHSYLTGIADAINAVKWYQGMKYKQQEEK